FRRRDDRADQAGSTGRSKATRPAGAIPRLGSREQGRPGTGDPRPRSSRGEFDLPFRTVEPCTTFSYVRSKDQYERGLKPTSSKCLHLYKYFIHPVFGFMSARLQTWFPFNVQICMNGREWLARQFVQNGRTDFKRVRNCFPWIGDFELAQRLMNDQLKTEWPRALTRI